MNLNDAELGKEYVIADVQTEGDEEMKSFLFLWDVIAAKDTVVDKKRNLVVSIKDARYNIDRELAAAIIINK